MNLALIARLTLLIGLIAVVPAHAQAPTASSHTNTGRWLLVDARNPDNPAAFTTLKDAATIAQPGDTIWIAPGSGPYREELFIRASGTREDPITVEGNGNEITGFEPLVFSQADKNHTRIARIKTAFPFVLRHRGRRILQKADTGTFTAPIIWDASQKTLTLTDSAVSADGWEISVRTFAVRIQDASHHLYRNLTASGSLNDGFNLHGSGTNLIFENITGCDNLDEGFSAHDDIHCEINGGRFYGNDNGIYNIQRSNFRIQNLDIFQNIGIGLAIREATLTADNVRVWASGIRQLHIEQDGTLRGSRIAIYRLKHTSRPWLTYKESSGLKAISTFSGQARDTTSLVMAKAEIIRSPEISPFAPKP